MHGERHNYCFMALLTMKMNGREDQVELCGLILIHITDDRISTFLRGIKTFKGISNNC
jgi:hypothetical protein